MSDTSSLHKKQAKKIDSLKIAVVTVSDTRQKSDDISGRFLRESIEREGHQLAHYSIVLDEREELERVFERISSSSVQVILFNGGTGISRRDQTYDFLKSKLEKELPGFGEIFRFLSYREIGSPAILSRAVAGIYKGKLIFSTPGSPKAVELAWSKLIAPELKHLVWELRK